MWAGSKLADNIPYTEKTVAEEIEEKQLKEENDQISKAIDEGDLETVYNYSSQFKEQVVDEQGNPVTDENGNPVLQIAKIYEDEKKQAEFEKRVASLDNFVETEVVKQQRAEELRQEAERELEEAKHRLQQTIWSQSQRGSGSGTGYFGTTNNTSYNFGSSSQTKGYYDFGQGAPATNSSSYNWQNPAWQNSLGEKFDSNNFYSFNPSSYSMADPDMYKFGKDAA